MCKSAGRLQSPSAGQMSIEGVLYEKREGTQEGRDKKVVRSSDRSGPFSEQHMPKVRQDRVVVGLNWCKLDGNKRAHQLSLSLLIAQLFHRQPRPSVVRPGPSRLPGQGFRFVVYTAGVRPSSA